MHFFEKHYHTIKNLFSIAQNDCLEGPRIRKQAKRLILNHEKPLEAEPLKKEVSLYKRQRTKTKQKQSIKNKMCINLAQRNINKRRRF